MCDARVTVGMWTVARVSTAWWRYFYLSPKRRARREMLRRALTGVGTAAALTGAAAAALPATEHTPSGLTVLRLLPAGLAGAVRCTGHVVQCGLVAVPCLCSKCACACVRPAQCTRAMHMPLYLTVAACCGGASATDAEPRGERALRCGRGVSLRHLPLRARLGHGRARVRAARREAATHWAHRRRLGRVGRD